jgi:hypothetical protein
VIDISGMDGCIRIRCDIEVRRGPGLIIHFAYLVVPLKVRNLSSLPSIIFGIGLFGERGMQQPYRREIFCFERSSAVPACAINYWHRRDVYGIQYVINASYNCTKCRYDLIFNVIGPDAYQVPASASDHFGYSPLREEMA